MMKERKKEMHSTIVTLFKMKSGKLKIVNGQSSEKVANTVQLQVLEISHTRDFQKISQKSHIRVI